MVRAYRGVLKEKEALETTLKALSVQQEESVMDNEDADDEGLDQSEMVAQGTEEENQVEEQQEKVILYLVLPYHWHLIGWICWAEHSSSYEWLVSSI